MQFSPLAIRRRYILGNLTENCDSINRIPVYLNNKSEEPIGYADESLGRYADAFLFHLPEDICKRLAANGYDLDIDYEIRSEEAGGGKNERIKLNHIILTSREAKAKLPRRHSYAKPTA